MDEQAKILEDGEVTATEYEDAVQLTTACFENAGIDVGGPWLNPVDSLTLIYYVEIPTNAAPQTSDGIPCDEAYLSLVQPNYIETNEQHMAADLVEKTASCLTNAGVAVPPELPTNAEAFADVVGDESASLLLDCISDAQFALYPEIPTVVVLY